MAEINLQTDYTETDPNAHITVATTRATFTAIHKDEGAYVYKDWSAAYFSGDFIHILECQFTAQAGGRCCIWSLTNTVDDMQGIDAGNGDALFVAIQTTGTNRLQLEEIDGGSNSNDETAEISISTSYYLKIKRDESVGSYGTIYCYIYTDSSRTTLWDTLAVTLHTSKKDFRYHFAVQSFNDNVKDNTETLSGYSDKHDMDPYWSQTLNGVSTPNKVNGVDGVNIAEVNNVSY